MPEGATFVAGHTPLQISYQGGDGNDVVLTVVPEPMGVGLVIMAVFFVASRMRTRLL
jgi:hypothetical protein